MMSITNVTEAFGRNYRTALAVVMALVLGNQVLVQPYLMRLATDAPWINVAGRQRMLSQRLVKAALVADRTGDEASREEMRLVLDLWSASHLRLLRDDVGAMWAGRNSAAVLDEMAGLEPHFVAMRDAARGLIDSTGRARASLGVLLGHEADYLRRMDRVVGLYEAEAQGRIATLRVIGWVLAGLTLMVLTAIGLFILRPAAGLIRRQVAELARARDTLEARVSERTRDLEAARERHRALLEQFSHAGRIGAVGEMASALAHELNQPLGAIANYAEGCLIALQDPEPRLDEVREALDRLRVVTMRAGRIIGQVRRFVTRQGPTCEAFEANRVVADAMEILGFDAQRRGIAVTIATAPGLPWLWGDPIQVQQVVVNLARNALESLAHSQVPRPTVVISTRRVESGEIEFGVSDNGEGIPADRLDRIFDAYFSTRAGGMGMGLAISRTIAEAHHGRLDVESEPGARTTFRFRLPADRGDGPHRG